MATEYELYQGAYSGAEIDAAIAASGTHIADTSVHLSQEQATKIAAALVPSDLTTLSGDVAKDTAGLSSVINRGAKNIIQNNLIVLEKNGVTATVNADKSITFTGTSTKTSGFILCYDMSDGTLSNSYTTKNPVKSGQYVVKGTGDSRVKVQAWVYSDSSDIEAATNSTDDATFTATSAKPFLTFRLYIAASADFTTPLTIYPMCVLKSEYDITNAYFPYLPDIESLAADFVDFSKYENPVQVAWINGKFINTSGVEDTATNYSHSTPFKIRKGQRIVFNATGSSSVSILTKYVNGVATQLIDGSEQAVMRFTIPHKFWIADEDCTLIITHQYIQGNTTTRFVANEDVKPTIYNDEQFLSGSPLWKKKIVAVGDSLVHGSRIGEYPTWLNWIANKYRMTAVNEGINGSSIAELTPEQITANGGDDHDPIVDRYQTILQANTDADIIVYEGGANDRTQKVPIGDTDSTTKTEFCGAINRIINGTRIICPKAKIFFISIPWRWTTPQEYTNLDEADYADAMTAVCKAKSIPVRNPLYDGDIDFRNSYIAEWADEGIWLDGAGNANRHYSPDGYQYIIPSIEKFLSY